VLDCVTQAEGCTGGFLVWIKYKAVLLLYTGEARKLNQTGDKQVALAGTTQDASGIFLRSKNANGCSPYLGTSLTIWTGRIIV
jgi:hypothetical protein